MNLVRYLFVAVLLGVFATGCATIEPMVAINTGVPERVDLSGTWLFDAQASDDLRATMLEVTDDRGAGGDKVEDLPSGTRGAGRGGVQHAGPRSGGGVLRGFPVRAGRIDVTQTELALFIKFDLARVHEYVYGENAEVTIGQYFAERVSGWQGNQYVVVMRSDKNLITERYALSADGRQLQRIITVDGKRGDRTLTQFYNRK